MKAILLALFLSLLTDGWGEEIKSNGSDGGIEGNSFLPSLPSFKPNKADLERTKRLAKGGDKLEHFKLGVRYENGYGVLKDHKEAIKWYAKSAEQGFAKAQSNLGKSYFLGEGVPKDYKKALRWFTKAAEQGLAEAQYNLGGIYGSGEGVPKDYNKALRWFTKAAEQGLVHAQAMVGASYANGLGEAKNLIEGYAWYKVAIDNGNKEAREWIKEIALSPEQLIEAQSLSTQIHKRIEANKRN